MNTVWNWMGNPKYVGKVSTIATTSFQDAVTGIPTGACLQLQQASFIAASLPSSAVVSPTGDAWVYYLPGINPKVTTPVVAESSTLHLTQTRQHKKFKLTCLHLNGLSHVSRLPVQTVDG